MAALAQQTIFDFPAEFEVAGYLDDSRWGTFSVLRKQKGSSKAHQRSYKLCDLLYVLEQAQKDKSADYWISQGVFSKFNRLKTNLASIATAFVDIDYYHTKYLHLDPVSIITKLLRRCDELGIPEPSIIVGSGQGLQAKWFHENLPKNALARWDTMQRHLVGAFEALGGDMNARDASRVLRVVNTVNQKNLAQVKVLYVNNRFEIDEPIRYKFNDLASAIIPQKMPANDEILTEINPGKKKQRGSVSKMSSWQRGFSLNSLNWTRMCDLQNLIRLRGGDVGDGLREPMAFYLCNFYALRYYKELSQRPLDEWNEFRNLSLEAAPHWSSEKIREKTSNLYELTRRMARGETVEYGDKEYPPLYTPTNETLIDLFRITEVELLKMASIISPDEKRRRDTARKQKERRAAGMKERKEYDQERKAESDNKREQALKLRAEGMSIRAIAAEIGIGKSQVSNYLKSVQ